MSLPIISTEGRGRQTFSIKKLACEPILKSISNGYRIFYFVRLQANTGCRYFSSGSMKDFILTCYFEQGKVLRSCIQPVWSMIEKEINGVIFDLHRLVHRTLERKLIESIIPCQCAVSQAPGNRHFIRSMDR